MKYIESYESAKITETTRQSFYFEYSSVLREWLIEAKESCANEFELFLVGTKRDAVVCAKCCYIIEMNKHFYSQNIDSNQ